jgi:hypothetical protein
MVIALSASSADHADRASLGNDAVRRRKARRPTPTVATGPEALPLPVIPSGATSEVAQSRDPHRLSSALSASGASLLGRLFVSRLATTSKPQETG